MDSVRIHDEGQAIFLKIILTGVLRVYGQKDLEYPCGLTQSRSSPIGKQFTYFPYMVANNHVSVAAMKVNSLP